MEQLNKLFIVICILIALAIPGIAQELDPEVRENEDDALKELEEIEAPSGMTPEYPVTNSNIIYVEGENAVSTNFNREATLNFGCSGKRSLQLNRVKGLQGGAPFFADFVFLVEEPGIYEFWYGGTPPGPEDDLYPSYSSPFQYRVDNAEEPEEVYRENIHVVENYTPSYYWNLAGQLELSAGQHQIRFEVNQKRGYDSRYYFYLDSFFLVKREGRERKLGSPLPDFFPKDLDNRDLDEPFKSIDDYLIYIRDNPEEIAPLKELSLIYSLVGDYLNALKYLKRANIYDTYDEEVLLLMAKNQIWRGDIDAGLEGYSDLLGLNPEQPDLWLEAGKVAAWVGLLDDSINFLEMGIDQYPDNLDLIVNLGLTHLWAGNERQAEVAIQKAKDLAGSDPEKIKELARVFIVNGYPDKAINIYISGIKENPTQIDLYIQLQETYYNSGNKKGAEKIFETLKKAFVPSPKLEQYLKITETKLKEKETILSSYKSMLDEEPDDLELREMLAQAYFWNGLKKEAIEEYLNILANHTFQSLQELEKNSQDQLKQMDRLYLYDAFYSEIASRIANKSRDLNIAIADYKKAIKASEDFQAKKSKAKAAGKEEPLASVDYQAEILESENIAVQFLGELETLFNQFDRVSNSLQNDIGNIREIVEEDQKDKEGFEKITQPIGWKWRRGLMIDELKLVEARGMALATHVLAKINQYENQLDEASADFVKLKTKMDYPSLDYAVYQSLLWNGSLKDAFDIYNAFAESIDAYASYVPEIKQSYDEIKPQETLSNAADNGLIDHAAKALEKMKTILGQVNDKQRNVNESLDLVRDIMEARMIRAFYRNQENTYLLRNELGAFYLSEGNRQAAIDQFQLVLDIDPWDINAVYQLGTVYEWNNQWLKAMENYKQVYWADPTYQNVTALYNNLARQHADQLSFQASYLADTASITWNGEFSFKTEFTELVGMEASYSTENKRVFRYFDDKRENHDEQFSAFQTHNILLGFPLNFNAGTFKFTPMIGGVTYLLDKYYDAEREGFSDTQIPETINLYDFFAYNAVHGIVKGKLSMNFYPFVNLDITGGFGLYEQTLGYTQVKTQDISGIINFILNLSSIDIPIVKNSSLRIFSEIDHLLASPTSGSSNTIYSITTELGLKLLEISEPNSISWNIFGNYTFQNSSLSEAEVNSIDYYSPLNVIATGGGTGFSGYFPLSENNVFGINLQTGLGYAAQNEAYNSSRAERLKLYGDLTFEYTRGSTTLYLGGQFTNLMNFASGEWDYYSFFLRTGFTARMPNLLTP